MHSARGAQSMTFFTHVEHHFPDRSSNCYEGSILTSSNLEIAFKFKNTQTLQQQQQLMCGIACEEWTRDDDENDQA